MDVPVAPASAEIIVKNSRFIAETFPVESQPAARELLRQQKERYRDAAHVVHAFAVGPAAEVYGMSDDGEPPGTAGRPVLDILKGKNCTNILLTVTRYFGGVLLGTGGLVKAYGDAAKAVLVVTGMQPLSVRRRFVCTVPYESYEQTKRMLSSLGATNMEETFETEVTIRGLLEKTAAVTFTRQLADLTNGRIQPDFP